jgi:hypothetical protein
MADTTLTFAGWTRERLADLVTGAGGGRATGVATLTLAATDAGGTTTGSESRSLPFALAGPADVIGLRPGAITRRYPTPGATDHESDRCPLVEFAEEALPWRYTPAPKPAAGTGAIHPWVVLIVGTEPDELTLRGSEAIVIDPAVQQAHPLGAPTSAYPWAHVQVDQSGQRIGRVLSGRPLQAGIDYLVALVAAFRADGQPSWNGSAAVTVPVFDFWRFRTATPAGSFEELAAALKPGEASADTGRAPLDYPRVASAPDLEVRGALAPIGATDAPLPDQIGGDLAGLRTPATDEVGRPIIGLPRYGDAWRSDAPDQSAWGKTLNGDPRHRGVAGLGLELGIRLQEELVEQAVTQAGALAEARQRLGYLVLGLSASGALWRRRLPATAHEQLWLLGPALGRVATSNGTLRERSTAVDRSLPAGIWSTAARRVLRSGPVRVRSTAPGTVAAGPALAAANRIPPAPQPSLDGVRLPAAFDGQLERVLTAGAPARESVIALAQQATVLAARTQGSTRTAATRIAQRLGSTVPAGRTVPIVEAMVLLASGVVARRPEQHVDLTDALDRLGTRFDQQVPANREQVATMTGLGPGTPPIEPSVVDVGLDVLAAGVAAAFDPAAPTSAARTRVLGQIGGIDPERPLSPLEACVGLDRPLWRDVDGAFPEWLLPGLSAMPVDAVIALETNPVFVASLLVGLNTQLLGELRWRNVQVTTGCTPLRGFWQRSDATTGDRVDDILGVARWSDTAGLGDKTHRPATLAGRDLVIAVRGRLFLRYPTTVVYLIDAATGGVANFDADPAPAAQRLLPTFQGRIGADVSFFGFGGFDPARIGSFWLVFEEPPAGYRFANDVAAPAAPAEWAVTTFARPIRVLIRGDRLVPGDDD